MRFVTIGVKWKFLCQNPPFIISEDTTCHYFHAFIRNIKYALDLIGDSIACYEPS